jgi:hypothetical protein
VYLAVLPELQGPERNITDGVHTTGFPFNALRNVAIDRVGTPWAM